MIDKYCRWINAPPKKTFLKNFQILSNTAGVFTLNVIKYYLLIWKPSKELIFFILPAARIKTSAAPVLRASGIAAPCSRVPRLGMAASIVCATIYVVIWSLLACGSRFVSSSSSHMPFSSGSPGGTCSYMSEVAPNTIWLPDRLFSKRPISLRTLFP